jgi:hypothetical protein
LTSHLQSVWSSDPAVTAPSLAYPRLHLRRRPGPATLPTRHPGPARRHLLLTVVRRSAARDIRRGGAAAGLRTRRETGREGRARDSQATLAAVACRAEPACACRACRPPLYRCRAEPACACRLPLPGPLPVRRVQPLRGRISARSGGGGGGSQKSAGNGRSAVRGGRGGLAWRGGGVSGALGAEAGGVEGVGGAHEARVAHHRRRPAPRRP